jgi:hypothetical protein
MSGEQLRLIQIDPVYPGPVNNIQRTPLGIAHHGTCRVPFHLCYRVMHRDSQFQTGIVQGRGPGRRTQPAERKNGEQGDHRGRGD